MLLLVDEAHACTGDVGFDKKVKNGTVPMVLLSTVVPVLKTVTPVSLGDVQFWLHAPTMNREAHARFITRRLTGIVPAGLLPLCSKYLFAACGMHVGTLVHYMDQCATEKALLPFQMVDWSTLRAIRGSGDSGGAWLAPVREMAKELLAAGYKTAWLERMYAARIGRPYSRWVVFPNQLEG